MSNKKKKKENAQILFGASLVYRIIQRIGKEQWNKMTKTKRKIIISKEQNLFK